MSRNASDKFHVMPIIKPVYPQQNSAYNVTLSSRTVMVDEFCNGISCRFKGNIFVVELLCPTVCIIQYKDQMLNTRVLHIQLVFNLLFFRSERQRVQTT